MKPGDLVLFYHSNATPLGLWWSCQSFSICQSRSDGLDKKKNQNIMTRNPHLKTNLGMCSSRIPRGVFHFITFARTSRTSWASRNVCPKKRTNDCPFNLWIKHFEFLCKQGRAKWKIHLAPMEGVVDHILRDLWRSLVALMPAWRSLYESPSPSCPIVCFRLLPPELTTNSCTPSGTPISVQLLGRTWTCLPPTLNKPSN